MNVCPYCDGEGENLDMARCMDCEGSGILFDGEIAEEENECFYCHGSGKDELDEMGVCKPCGGKGFA